MIVSDVFSPDPDAWSLEARVAHAALRAALTDEPFAPLLAAAGADIAGADVASLDPDRFAAYCRRQGIIPTVHATVHEAVRRTRGTPQAVLLDDAEHALRSAAHAAAGAALFQSQQLAEILERFAEEDVPVIVLKGLHLDVNAYRGPGRRKDGDHDLLVPHAHIQRAAGILRELGFSMNDGSRDPDDEPGEHHAPPFFRQQDGQPPVMVELHWDLTPSTPTLPLPGAQDWTAAAWQRAEPAVLLGQTVQRLTVEDESVLLALHVARHLTYYDAQVAPRLSMIEDLVRVLRRAPDADARQIKTIAEALGSVPLFGPVRYLSRAALGIDVTLGREKVWPHRHIDRRLVNATRVLQDPGLDRSDYRRRWDQVAAHAALMPRMADWRRVWRRAFRNIPAHATAGQEAVEPMESWLTRSARLSWRLLSGKGAERRG